MMEITIITVKIYMEVLIWIICIMRQSRRARFEVEARSPLTDAYPATAHQQGVRPSDQRAGQGEVRRCTVHAEPSRCSAAPPSHQTGFVRTI